MSTVKMMRALPQGRHIAKAEQGGMALLEALIALLIFSIAVLGLVGIQANMVTNTTEAQFRSIATYIAQQKISRVWARPADADRNAVIESENDPDAGKIIDPNLLPSGFVTISNLDNPAIPESRGMVRVTVTWGVSEDEHDDQAAGVAPRLNNVTIDARVMEGDES